MNDGSADAVEVEAAARDYIEGWYTGDAARSVTKARMVQLTEEGGGSNPDAEVEIFVDDCAGDIAAVRVLSPDYLDYLHLVMTTRGWKIKTTSGRWADRRTAR